MDFRKKSTYIKNGDFKALQEHILGLQRNNFILTWLSFGLNRKPTYIDNCTFEASPWHTVGLLRNPLILTLL